MSSIFREFEGDGVEVVFRTFEDGVERGKREAWEMMREECEWGICLLSGIVECQEDEDNLIPCTYDSCPLMHPKTPAAADGATRGE